MTSRARVNLKSIALPTEHGGWGFLLEPILLALLIAPSWGGVFLSAAVVSVFLLHQPFKIALKDHIKQRHVPRTKWAERFTILYGSLGIILLLILFTFNGLLFMLPMLFGGIFALIQAFFDAQNKSRELIPEISGAIALGSTAASIALLAKWALLPALMLGIILIARAITAIIYVRVRLRMSYGKPHQKASVVALHVGSTSLFIILMLNHQVHFLVVVAMLLLLIRALKGLYFPVENTPAKVIGFSELAYGIMYVLVVAFGYWLLLL